MDHAASKVGPNSIIFHKYLPYLAYQANYQRLLATYGYLHTAGLYTCTSKLKWILWAYHHWELLIKMLSKSGRNLSNITSQNLGLQICNNQSMVKKSLTHRIVNLKTTSPSHRKRREMGRLKKDIRKWCDFHKIPWKNTDECLSK
jgi:hypothetical protein